MVQTQRRQKTFTMVNFTMKLVPISIALYGSFISTTEATGVSVQKRKDSSLEEYILGVKKITIESAEDYGRAHYDLIDQLESKFSKKYPKSVNEVMTVLNEELCHHIHDETEDEFHSCQNLRRRLTYSSLSSSSNTVDNNANKNRVPFGSKDYFQSILPENLDSAVKGSIDNALLLVELLETKSNDKSKNNDVVIHALDVELQQLKENSMVESESDREVGIAALSVFVESAKQWTEIYNNPNHIFFNIRNDFEKEIGKSNRLLQLQNMNYTNFTNDITVAASEMAIVVNRDAAGIIIGVLDSKFRGGGWEGRAAKLAVINSFIAFMSTQLLAYMTGDFNLENQPSNENGYFSNFP